MKFRKSSLAEAPWKGFFGGRFFLAVPVLLLFIISPTRPARAAVWEIHPRQTRVAFRVRQLRVNWVEGRLRKVEGYVLFDPEKPEETEVVAAIGAASIDTHNDERDEDLKSPAFLNADKYPKILFRSKKVLNAGPGGFDLVGDLTIHGVRKEVTLRVGDIGPERRDSRGQVKMSVRVSGKIDRRDFGLTWDPLIETLALVGNEISVTIEVRLVKK